MRNFYRNPHAEWVLVSTERGATRRLASLECFAADGTFYDRFVETGTLERISEEEMAPPPELKIRLSKDDLLKAKPKKYREEKLLELPRKKLAKIAETLGIPHNDDTHRLDIVRQIVRLNGEVKP